MNALVALPLVTLVALVALAPRGPWRRPIGAGAIALALLAATLAPALAAGASLGAPDAWTPLGLALAVIVLLARTVHRAEAGRTRVDPTLGAPPTVDDPRDADDAMLPPWRGPDRREAVVALLLALAVVALAIVQPADPPRIAASDRFVQPPDPPRIAADRTADAAIAPWFLQPLATIATLTQPATAALLAGALALGLAALPWLGAPRPLAQRRPA
ncbi:MAG: hypothetical protein AAF772_08020, partial [Acidobacteriota bacterium]